MYKLFLLFFVVCLVSHGQTPLTKGGRIYLSKDRGANWAAFGTGIPGDVLINAWVVHDGVIVAGTNAHGVFISSDQIKTWYPSSKGLPNNTRIISMASFNHLLFAGTHTSGVFVSTDRGAHWQPTNSGLKNFTARCFYANGSVLLAGTDSGIYSSSDNGNVWKLEQSGLQINDFKSTTNAIFAATNQGVLASKDLGNTWEWIFSDGAIFELAISENEIYAMDFFGTVFRSNLTNFTWIKTDLYFPFEDTFRPTPVSRKFLTTAYGDLNQPSTGRHNNNLPIDAVVNKMLATPFGLLAAALPSEKD